MTIMCGRALAAAVVLLLVITLKSGGSPECLRALGWPGFLVALFFAADSSCYMAALHFTTVAHVVVMLSLTPLFTALAAWLVMREAIRPRVACRDPGLVRRRGADGFGQLWRGCLDRRSAGAGRAHAVCRGDCHHPPPSWRASDARRLPGGDPFGLRPSCPSPIFRKASPSDIALMTLLGSIEFGLGLVLYLAGAKLVPAAEAGLMSLLETVLAPLWVWLAVAEDPGWRAIAGGLVVLLALAGLALADLMRPVRIESSDRGHGLVVGDDQGFRVEAVEMGRRGVGIGAHAVDLDPVAILDIAGQFEGAGQHVEGIASRAVEHKGFQACRGIHRAAAPCAKAPWSLPTIISSNEP